MDQAAPDNSSFSRFRSQLSKKAMVQLSSALQAQLHAHGVAINESIAVYARLIRSASRSVSNEKLNELQEKQNRAEGNMDKNGNPKKFFRDLESDWPIKNDVSHYG